MFQYHYVLLLLITATFSQCFVLTAAAKRICLWSKIVRHKAQ